jgi:excisionase family DNA binding protein
VRHPDPGKPDEEDLKDVATVSTDLAARSGGSRALGTGDKATVSPWLTVHEAADRAKCGIKTIYREVKSGRLRAAKVGGRRELRLLAAWVDEWLIASVSAG